eukprot:GFUD01030655.1.p1 GENE.GFUD01030655.1~~GFUD01030655.1.p1  ORF type:complete len:352 (+),score=107.66 GFUD01030655.1:96-1151(+)
MAKKDETPLSIVAAFDDIVRNSTVLTAGSEDEFLKFVVNNEVSRQRWEHAELECQKLSLELAKCSQDISGLEQKLQHARLMFDTEQRIRKKVEGERDRMASQLRVLRQLVVEIGHGLDTVTMEKIRSLDKCGVRSNTNILSPVLAREAMECVSRRRVNNLTEEDSVLDVEDLSFDETLGLCESRTRAGTTFNRASGGRDGRKKRSRSGNRKSSMMETEENARKKERRSRSVGINDNIEVVKIETRGSVRRSKEKEENIVMGQVLVGDHSLVERTVIKPEKCVACFKRFKFGKTSLKCLRCKGSIHVECKDKVGTCESSSATRVFSHPLPSLYTTPSKRENKNTIFASPRLR